MIRVNRLIAVSIAMALAVGSVSVAAGEAMHQDDRMAQMEQTMQRMRDTEDPNERAALMEQHMDEMHAAMAQMHRNLGRMMELVKEEKKQVRRLHGPRERRR